MFHITAGDVFNLYSDGWVDLFNFKCGFAVAYFVVVVSVVCHIYSVVVCVQVRYSYGYKAVFKFYVFEFVFPDFNCHVSACIYIDCNACILSIPDVGCNDFDIQGCFIYFEFVFSSCAFVFFVCREV